MNKIKYTFDLWNKKGVSMELPLEQNRINTSEFLPKSIFTKNAENSFFAQAFVGMSSGSDPNEVQNDLGSMLQYINNNQIDLSNKNKYYEIVNNSIRTHIENYNRIFFVDLCSYIDLAAHLMSINHFTEHEIHKFYIMAIYSAVQENGDLVKDGHPLLGIIPFSSTPKYKNIVELAKEYK